MDIITAVRYYKKEGEYIITYRNTNTGKSSKLHANHLNDQEKIFAKSSKYFFDDEKLVCWTN